MYKGERVYAEKSCGPSRTKAMCNVNLISNEMNDDGANCYFAFLNAWHRELKLKETMEEVITLVWKRH